MLVGTAVLASGLLVFKLLESLECTDCSVVLQNNELGQEHAALATTLRRLTLRQSWTLLVVLTLVLAATLVYISYDASSMIGYACMGLLLQFYMLILCTTWTRELPDMWYG